MSRDNRIRHAVRQHADASTVDNQKSFNFTPAQACLAWWGLKLLGEELGRIDRDSPTIVDDLRTHADAIEWTQITMRSLLEHAYDHKISVVP